MTEIILKLKNFKHVPNESRFAKFFTEEELIKIRNYTFLDFDTNVYYLRHDITEIVMCMCGKPVGLRGQSKGLYKTCGDEDCIKNAKKDVPEESKIRKSKAISNSLKEQHRTGQRIHLHSKISEAVKHSPKAKAQRVERAKIGNKALKDKISNMSEEDRIAYHQFNHARAVEAVQLKYGVDNVMKLPEFINKNLKTKADKGYIRSPNDLGDYELYERLVRNLTKKQPLMILQDIEKRGRYEYHLDHKFSIFDGYKNCILPMYIANINNLEMIPFMENCTKSRNSSIAMDVLFELVVV